MARVPNLRFALIFELLMSTDVVLGVMVSDCLTVLPDFIWPTTFVILARDETVPARLKAEPLLMVVGAAVMLIVGSQMLKLKDLV